MNPDLFGRLPDEISIQWIQEYEPPEGYWLAFSGGKDSVVLFDLAMRSGVKFDAHYNNTTCDPPELVRFMKKQYPQVAIENPPQSIWRLIPKRGLPMRNRRWCCDALKERGGIGRVVLTGIRDEESPKRRRRGMVEHCQRHPTKRFVHPIKFWRSTEIWQYIRERNIPYCSLYDEGFKRLGCVICPFDRNVSRSMERWPQLWKAMRRASNRLYERREKYKARWSSADEMWLWWIDRDSKWRQEDTSLPLFP